MMKVVGYRDLRPLDWLSGKRMPLGPGEGHLCDRCGAEHAVIYEVLDTETGKTYAVGSTCATKQFGFAIDKDKEAKALVKRSKEAATEEVDRYRQAEVAEVALVIAGEVMALPVPDFSRNVGRYTHAASWEVGDSWALEAPGRTADETQKVALDGWVLNRVRERIPAGWDVPLVRLRAGAREKTTVSMAKKTERLALANLGLKGSLPAGTVPW